MKNRPLLIIFLIIFFDLLAFGIVIPILPYYTKMYGANAFQLGWIMAIYSIMQFLFAPFWGSLSDRHGRRPILLISILGAAFAMLLMGLAKSLLMIFIARALAGIFAANISTASAYITDVTDESNRAKGMGIIGAGFGLGFIFGPAIGGLLSPLGYSTPILAAAGMAFFNFVLAYIILHEPEISESDRQKNRRKFSLQSFKAALSNRATAAPASLMFLATFAFTNLEVTFALFLLARYNYDAKQAGLLLALVGFIMAMIQGGAIGRLSKRFGEARLVVFGLLALSVSLISAGYTESIGIFIFWLIWVALGNALINPSLSSLMSKAAPADQRGSMMGIFQSAGSLARIVGPPLAGLMFDRLGIAWPMYVAGLLMFLAAIASVRFLNLKQHQAKAT